LTHAHTTTKYTHSQHVPNKFESVKKLNDHTCNNNITAVAYRFFLYVVDVQAHAWSDLGPRLCHWCSDSILTRSCL